MSKSSFIMYQSWGAAIANMSNEQAGSLLKAIYALDSDPGARPDDPAVGFVFDLIKQKIDEDVSAYEEKCAKRAEAGRVGANQKQAKLSSVKQNVANEANADFAKQNEAKQANADFATPDTESESESESDTESLTTQKRESVPKGTQKRETVLRFHPPTSEEVRAYAEERGSKVDPERFVDFYTSKGWRVGREPMRDWRAAFRNWEKTERARSGPCIADRVSVVDSWIGG